MGQFCYTKLGLTFFIVGMIMVLLSTIPLLAFIQDIVVGENLPILIALALIAFIGLVFYLVAYILMCVGGIAHREFGDKHRKFLLISLIILIVVIVVSIIQSVYQSFTIFSIANESASTGSIDFSPIKNVMYFSVVVSAISGFLYIFILHELENKIGKIILYAAYVSSVVISIVTAYLFISIFDTWAAQVSDLVAKLDSSGSALGQSIANMDALNTINQGLTNEITKYSVYGIIPSILWLIAMIIPFYRIHTGELVPVAKSNSIRRCNNCGFDVPQYSETCPKCGQFYGAAPSQQTQSALKFCPECGHKNEESKTFCEECGTQF